MSSCFRKELLPPPRLFYERELGKLGRPSRGWARARYPFHQPDRNPSFSINLNSGGFYCFACGAKGGDILAFVMLRDNIDFKAAAVRLGVWVNDGRHSAEHRQRARREQQKREHINEVAVDLAEAERQLRFEYRDEIHLNERITREMQQRLQDCQVGSSEYEDCVAVLSMVLPELREAIAGYYLLSFGSTAERLDFILYPEKRAEAISAVMLRGTVRDDDGHVMEVCFD
jgi:hypothetical protein